MDTETKSQDDSPAPAEPAKPDGGAKLPEATVAFPTKESPVVPVAPDPMTAAASAQMKTEDAPSVISANNLSLTFSTNDGPVHALSNVSLDIHRG